MALDSGYIGRDGVARKFTTGYIGIDGVARQFMIRTGTSWMSSSNGHSSPYAYTNLEFAGVGVTRTYWFHVSSITGGTLQVGVKHGTWEDDFTSKITVTKAGWYSFTHALSSNQDPYTRFAIKMSDGGSASHTSTTLTVTSSSGTANVVEVLVS